jgi:hypothetical protein
LLRPPGRINNAAHCIKHDLPFDSKKKVGYGIILNQDIEKIANPAANCTSLLPSQTLATLPTQLSLNHLDRQGRYAYCF